MALPLSRLPRQAKVLIACCLVLVVLCVSYISIDVSNLSQYAQYADYSLGTKVSTTNLAMFTSQKADAVQPNTPQAHEFWRELAKLLEAGDPSKELSKMDLGGEGAGWVGFEGIRKDAEQPDLVKLSEKNLEELKKLHGGFVEGLAKITEKLPFMPGTRGIATTAGPTAESILSTSLRMVRKSGSTLPIQVWYYNRAESDPYTCEHVYAPLDAHCMYMVDYLAEDTLADGPNPLVITQHFQMKILTMIFSTFEQVLFMDCDLFSVNNPDSIFITEPFISKGWVLWPDYWANTNSKFYSQIVDKPMAKMYDRQSTESGAMLANKATHAAAMLLATYYNRHGPQHYYWLFSQGAIGHGDKDTYVPACVFYDLPFYQVDNPPRRIGYRCDGNERAIASGQAHPHDDWLLTSQGVSRAHGNLLADVPEPRTLFIHGNLPKNDPVSLMDYYIPESWDDELYCDHGKGEPHRQWGPKENTMLIYGWDAEKALWDQMRWLGCTHGEGVKRWKEGYLVNCTDEAIGGNWCPKSSRGQIYVFQQPRTQICENFTKVYEDILPEEVYDPSLPVGGLPERPWSSLARLPVM